MARQPSTKYFQYLEKSQQNLKACGRLLIAHISEMTKDNEELHEYMDEMLHSIFFLGCIFKSRLTPGDFFLSPDSHRSLEEKFPEPFRRYNTHLPSHTPFSILLDMMEKLHGPDKLISELQNLMEKLNFPPHMHQPGKKTEPRYTLEATVICVCYSEPNPQRYFGASLSCRTGNSKRIMIDVSCLNTWHEFVSHAVMSFSLTTEDPATGDGLTFPESVQCQAYRRRNNVYVVKRPCLKCKQLFNLQNADEGEVQHPYGNCAETECLSKLLLNNQYVQNTTMIQDHTKKNSDRLRDLTKRRLKDELAEVNFQINDEQFLFYRPT